ncbi:MAG TPA: hypothetical protein VH681_01270 [Nitrospiraceae bacterium]|jgi:hypothetical protein
MNATTAFLCVMTLSLATVATSTQLQISTASATDEGSTGSGSRERGKPAIPRKADPDMATRGTPSAGKPNQTPAPFDRSQAVEERLRSGQMDKPIAQGEISDRLNGLYSGSNSVTRDTAAEHSSR